MKFNIFNLIKLKKAGYKVTLKRRNKGIPNNSYNTYFKQCVSGSCSGADLIGKDVIVPVGEKFEWSLYTNTAYQANEQYIVTKMTDKYWFFWTFEYAKDIIKINEVKYDPEKGIDKQEALRMCDKGEYWNRYSDMISHYGEYGAVAFLDYYHGDRKDIFPLGDNDYSFLEEVKR